MSQDKERVRSSEVGGDSVQEGEPQTADRLAVDGIAMASHWGDSRPLPSPTELNQEVLERPGATGVHLAV